MEAQRGNPGQRSPRPEGQRIGHDHQDKHVDEIDGIGQFTNEAVEAVFPKRQKQNRDPQYETPGEAINPATCGLGDASKELDGVKMENSSAATGRQPQPRTTAVGCALPAPKCRMRTHLGVESIGQHAGKETS